MCNCSCCRKIPGDSPGNFKMGKKARDEFKKILSNLSKRIEVEYNFEKQSAKSTKKLRAK